SITVVDLTTPLSTSTRIETPPYPLSGTGASLHHPLPTGSLGTGNHSGPPCTVNVPQATIGWWYAATYQWPVADLMGVSGVFNDSQRHYTTMPQQATFNVTSVLTEYAYTTTEDFDSEWNMTFTYLLDYTVKPTAAVTSVITRTAYAPLPSGQIIAENDLGLYQTEPGALPAASFTVALANRTVPVATSATPVAYFSAYEVESAVAFTAGDGAVAVSTVTRTFALSTPYACSFWMKGIESTKSASGTVPLEFIQQIPQATCSPGTLSGSVTVLVVVDLIYRQIIHVDPFDLRIEESVLGWDDPGPETDIRAHVQTKGGPEDPFNSGRIEVPADGFLSGGTPSINAGVLQTDSPSPANQGQASPAGAVNVPLPTPTTVGSIGTVPVVIGPSSVVVVGSETLKPGSQITVGGNPVSLEPAGSNIVVGTKTSALPVVPVGPAPNNPPPPIITIRRSTLTPNAATQFSLAPGQILTPGGRATLDGTVVSLGPSASFVVIGGSTRMLPPPIPAATPPPTIVLGQSTFTQLPGSSFIIGSQTLSVGHRGAFVIDGQTLAIGGHPVTVSGTTLSLAASNVLVVNGMTSTLDVIPAEITPPPLTIGDTVLTALPGDGTTYELGTLRLTPGGVITSGTLTISLAPGATALIINGVTTTLVPGNQIPITNPPLLTIGSETFTANSGTTFTIHGQILTPGGVIIFDGTTVSLSPLATEMIVESAGTRETTTLFPATTT
ncbi:uncharacterized protein EI97DRAFT_350256, partial [Westerdykella ornata]